MRLVRLAFKQPRLATTTETLCVCVHVRWRKSTVDAYEFSSLEKPQLTISDMSGVAQNPDPIVEYKPFFHEWATVQPGMICVARKKKTSVFRQYVAAETAVPVIACAACLPKTDEMNYYFAGVARSKSVRSPDDGMGAKEDEYFTVSIGGMATILNTSNGPIHPGDLIEWCFHSGGTSNSRRAKMGPRRIGIQVASVSSPKIVGRALSFAKSGETFDVSAGSTNQHIFLCHFYKIDILTCMSCCVRRSSFVSKNWVLRWCAPSANSRDSREAHNAPCCIVQRVVWVGMS